MASENILTLTGELFENEVVHSDIPVLVDFWAPWCGPCRMVGPVIEELANEFNGKVKFAKANVDEEGELASRFKIMSIPTIMLFKSGQSVDKVVGARSKSELAEFLNKNI